MKLSKTTLMMSGGDYLDVLKPNEYRFDLEECLSGLWDVRRFNGRLGNYNVLQHSFLTYTIEAANKEFALLHDITECVTGDIISPIKNAIPGFKELENALLKEMLYQLNEKAFISYVDNPDSIKQADLVAMTVEIINLHEPRTAIEWGLGGLIDVADRYSDLFWVIEGKSKRTLIKDCLDALTAQ